MAINITSLTEYQQWQTGKEKLVGAQDNSAFNLCFQLEKASEKSPDNWYLKFIASLKKDPTLKLELSKSV